MAIIAAGAFAQTAVHPGSGSTVVLPGLFLVGLGAGLVLGPLSAAVMESVPPARAGMAAGAANTFRQFGYAFGVAVLGESFRRGLENRVGADLVDPLSSGQAAALMARSDASTELVHAASSHALDNTFVVAAGLALVAGVAVLVLVRPSRESAT